MKIFTIKASGTYGGGMAVVAAKNETTARQLAAAIKDKTWRVKYDQPDIVTSLAATNMRREAVLDHYETGE